MRKQLHEETWEYFKESFSLTFFSWPVNYNDASFERLGKTVNNRLLSHQCTIWLNLHLQDNGQATYDLVIRLPTLAGCI